MAEKYTYHVVRFARENNDEPRTLLVCDDQYKRWNKEEPANGYSLLMRLETFSIDATTAATVDDLDDLLDATGGGAEGDSFFDEEEDEDEGEE